jgi:hypothetical protein
MSGDERRKNRRYAVGNLKTRITDGKSACVVKVEDISPHGVGVSGLPQDFDENVSCVVEIKCPQGDFKLELQPRWVHLNKGKRKKIGFQIHEPTREWLDFLLELKKAEAGGCKRSSSRLKTVGLMAMVSNDGSRCFGIVEDISENGLRLTQIPAEFADSAASCSAVVHSLAGDVNISLRPCWIRATTKGMYKTIGFEIQDPPPDWQELIETLQQETGGLDFLLPEEEKNKKQ